MDSGTSISSPNLLHSVSGSESRADVRLERARLRSVRIRGTLSYYIHNWHPLKKVIITETTREVLFLQTDWCQQLRMATTAPLPLPQRRSRRLRGQKPLSPSRRQVEEEWSGASPTPPLGGSPLSGAPPSPVSRHECSTNWATRAAQQAGVQISNTIQHKAKANLNSCALAQQTFTYYVGADIHLYSSHV